MNPMVLERACAARLLVAISFHFDAARVCFFAEVLRSLAEFPVSAMHVTILTNTLEDDELDLLRRLCSEILTGKVTSIESHTNLSNPWHLTWCHKPMISKQFLGDSDDEYTHFIYLEGDIRLSFVNFCYFVEFREALRNYGLLPSFIRMEYRTAVAGFTTSDVFCFLAGLRADTVASAHRRSCFRQYAEPVQSLFYHGPGVGRRVRANSVL
jgi:hypothetical protein